MAQRPDPSQRLLMRQVIGMVAKDRGLSFDEAAQMPGPDIQSAALRITERELEELNEVVRNEIALRRIGAAMESHNVPEGVTIGEAIERGLLPATTLEEAFNVSDVDIEAAIAEADIPPAP